jgi:Icc-related predicted phosphoesterase
MRVAVCSDLHLEFGDIVLKNTDSAEVLILSGDIAVAKDLSEESDRFNKKSVRYHTFFKNCCEEFSTVIYIMGNHEHYNGDFAETYDILKSRLSYLSNLFVLEKDTVKVGDITFVGGSLWTDMNNEDQFTMYHVARSMNDFRIIENSNQKLTRKVPIYKKGEDGQYVIGENGSYIQIGEKFKEYPAIFTPETAVDDHKKFLKYLETVLRKDGKFIVVGHHAPSKLSTHPRYQNDTLMNGGYSSSLDFFIEDHPEIVLWTHGHTHEIFDYNIGSTRIVCNPRGYINYEERADQFKLKFIDV